MENKQYPWAKNEQGFLIGLVFLALFGLFYLFSDFMLPIVFAVVITCATYPLYELLLKKVKREEMASGIMISLLSILVILPIVYLFSVSSMTIFDVYSDNQDFIKELNFDELSKLKDSALGYLPLEDKTIAFLSAEIDKNSLMFFESAKGFAVNASKEFLDNSMSTIMFIALSVFAMFFFFKDGRNIVQKIKVITPLHDDFDDLLLMELYSLCGILTVSVFTVAFLQGLTFGILVSFMDVNWLFIAISIAVTSFIPLVGSLLVWIPLAIYMFVVDEAVYAIIVLVWGLVVNGFVIDNLMRPWIISKVCAVFDKNTSCDLSDFNPLDNVFIIILSTLGAFPLFGVVGLFLGPIIAAISITILDLYILRIQASEEAISVSKKETIKEEVEEIILESIESSDNEKEKREQ